LKDGVNGFVMKGRDTSAWIDRMRYILFDMKEEERSTITDQMNTSLAEHGKEHAIELLVSVYARVAGNK
jgi:hypothetical protein